MENETSWKDLYASTFLGILLKIYELSRTLDNGNFTGQEEPIIKAKLEMLMQLQDQMLEKLYNS